MLARRVFRIHLLNIIGNDDAAYGTLGLGNAHGAVDDMAHLRRRRHHMHVFMRNILEQGNKIDFLLVTAPHRGAFLLADNGHHRLMIELGVIQAIE